MWSGRSDRWVEEVIGGWKSDRWVGVVIASWKK